VTAVDIVPEAISLAEENAELNGVKDKIAFIKSDWFNRLDGEYDLIVSNPPYVPSQDLERLAREVREHEPHRALDGGADGLREITAIVTGACDHLRSGGHLLLEIADGQGNDVEGMMRGFGLDVRIEPDLAGKERFAVARWP